MTNKVFFHKPIAPDDNLGRVDNDGKVYETRFGPDRYTGRVDIADGKVYEARVGFDHYLGRVELDTGKVYLSKTGPDEYIGRVESNGKLFRHRSLLPDEYVGKIVQMASYAHGGAAFLLLVKPVLDEEDKEVEKERPETQKPGVQGDAGKVGSGKKAGGAPKA
jgi:hypothetical protein